MRLGNRAVVDDTFLVAMKDMYEQIYGKSMKVYQENTNPTVRKNKSMVINRVAKILNNEKDGLRSGLDYELTRLRTLPYDEFRATKTSMVWYPNGLIDPILRKDIICFVGVTKPIVIKEPAIDNLKYFDDSRYRFPYHLGRYRIYIPVETFTEYRMEIIHMLPERNLLAERRFFHHKGFRRDASVESNPLTYQTHTCWGNYGPAIQGLLSISDLPLVFQALSVYLTRFNTNSPLARELDFNTGMEEE